MYLSTEIGTLIYEFDPTYHSEHFSRVVQEIHRYVGNVYKLTFFNRDEIQNGTTVFCLFCKQIYPSHEVCCYCDDNMTAICPHCEMDTVIPQHHKKYLLGTKNPFPTQQC